MSAATGARRNGTAVKAVPTAVENPTPEQRIADLETRLEAMENRFRSYVAQQMLKDPQVQAMLQKQLESKLASEEG